MKMNSLNISYLNRHPARRGALPRKEDGVMLIEVLVAIVILAFGILGIVGLQAKMTSNMSDSRFRSEAAFFADQLIGSMWADAHGGFDGKGVSNLGKYKQNDTVLMDIDADPQVCQNLSNTISATSSPVLQAWLGANDKPGTVLGDLPNGRARVAVDSEQVVTIQLCWQAPNDGENWHYHAVRTQIVG